jgi:hypothetical protein
LTAVLRRAFALAAALAALAVASAAHADDERPRLRLQGGGATPPCGSLANAYGPYDYRTQREYLKVVEDYHFSIRTENLIKPMGRNFGGDFDYTLRASPDHHRALLALARYSERVGQEKLADASYSVDCYFDRALRFAKDDMVVRMIYAQHLAHTGRAEAANAQLAYVVANAGDDPFTYFNAGLINLEMKEYERGLAAAHESMRYGMTRTELKDELVAAGKWVDPPAAAASAPAGAASTAGGAASAAAAAPGSP